MALFTGVSQLLLIVDYTHLIIISSIVFNNPNRYRYGRCELKTSDHRPVYALFTVDAQAVDWTKAEGVVEDVVG